MHIVFDRRNWGSIISTPIFQYINERIPVFASTIAHIPEGVMFKQETHSAFSAASPRQDSLMNTIPVR